MQAKIQWHDIFQLLSEKIEKNCQFRMQYSVEIYFKTGSKIKTFSDKQKLKELSVSRYVLQDVSKEVFREKENEASWKLRSKGRIENDQKW